MPGQPPPPLLQLRSSQVTGASWAELARIHGLRRLCSFRFRDALSVPQLLLAISKVRGVVGIGLQCHSGPTASLPDARVMCLRAVASLNLGTPPLDVQRQSRRTRSFLGPNLWQNPCRQAETRLHHGQHGAKAQARSLGVLFTLFSPALAWLAPETSGDAKIAWDPAAKSESAPLEGAGSEWRRKAGKESRCPRQVIFKYFDNLNAASHMVQCGLPLDTIPTGKQMC